ncbi:CASP-like protein 1C1 [Tripterygium wilfordii]|uniref:CASP-like protein n=1 Tax=Tripterygium wilfordii TaxID=458696 RepID=A0A7J7DI23_TRIWF|nr:CASP-like protein 1C1 [Tripterygium wilfordii]KAF5745953.1 CASP-like protein 1C1 [Tripterygium wilfordii]
MTKIKRVLGLLPRLLAFGATLSATIVMATSHERVNILGFSFEAKYTDASALKFFVIANAIVSAYGLLVLFLPWESLLWRLVVALDAVFTVILTSSISAALAIAEVGKKGNSHAGWLPMCGQVPKYCDQVTGALAVGFIGLIIYVVLLLYSIYGALNPLLVLKF